MPIMRRKSYYGYALLSLALLLVLGSACHVSLVPFRWGILDLGIVLPLLVCFGVSICGGRRIVLAERFAYGISQCVIVVWIFEDAYRRELAFGSGPAVYLTLIAIVFGYALLFGCSTHALAARAYADKKTDQGR